MLEPLVSVIIPVYNVSPYLREALDSVINQTYRNLEIIIVDDGSTDDSGLICDEYKKDLRVKVIHQENRGLSDARNTGLDLMTGDYVAFLDPDDAFYPEMIGRTTKAITDTQVDFVTCGYDVFETDGRMKEDERDGRVIPKEEKKFGMREIYQAFLERKYIHSVWNKLYSKNVWEHLRFQEGCVYEDLLITPQILEQSTEIISLPSALICHRNREGSITRTISVHNNKDRITAYKYVLEYCENIIPPLPQESISSFCEICFRTKIHAYCELQKLKTSSEEISLLKKEIFHDARDRLELRKTKTKVTWWLFRFCPGMVIPVQKCYQKVKKSFEREIVVVA